MCGLFFSTNSETVNCEKLLRQMYSRGPDNQGVIFEKNNIIAHSRLAITGVDNGGQPFVYSKFIAVCNGEIYNYKELIMRYDLKPKTESDCEVIPLLFEKFGAEKFHELDGMYAFIIYDKISNRVIWARDHIGEKPLYFYKTAGSLYLTSEINYLKAVKLNLAPNYFGLLEAIYLQFNKEHTPFLNLFESKPNVLYTYDIATAQIFDSNLRKEEVKFPNITMSEFFEEYSTRIKYAVDTTLLQGEFTPFLGYTSGYDSNIIKYISTKSHIPLNLITIGYSDSSSYDELSALSLDGQHVLPKDQYKHYKCVFSLEDLEMAYVDSITVRDALVFDGSGTSYYLLLKSVKNYGGKVFISGHGGDDVLLAYPWIRAMLGHLDVSDKDNLAKKTLTYAHQLVTMRRLLSKRIWSYRSYYKDICGILGDRTRDLESHGEKHLLTPTEALDEVVFGYLSRSGLLQMDRYSMHFGIESRTPLVRKDLMALTIQHIDKITKMKQARKELYSHVPGFGENFNNNVKRGFRTPLNSNTIRTRKLYKRHISRFVTGMLNLAPNDIEFLGINALRSLSAASIFYKNYGYH